MNTLLKRFSSIVLLAALPLVPAFAAHTIGKLYTMSNATAGNEVLVYERLSDGSLSKVTSVPSNGTGTGGGLGNQGALTFSKDGFFLFAVNAGSHSISSFRITATGLDLVSTVSSGGTMPVSVTEDRGRLFVLNAGNASKPGNILGFRVNHDGRLRPMPFTKRLLSSNTASTGAAQISFSDDGQQLVVTEKATNLILTYRVNDYGVPGKAVLNTSSGITPFGFAVGKRDQLFVSNAEGGTANISTLSSYRLLPYGKLRAISPEVATGETAACWVALTPDGRYAFTTNTASGTISSFEIELDGKAAVAESKAGITGNSSGPIDMVVSPESRYLYTLNAGNDTISSFEVGLDGTLSLITTLESLPDGANGLIAQ
jgi:6-phosphogluconolactonase